LRSNLSNRVILRKIVNFSPKLKNGVIILRYAITLLILLLFYFPLRGQEQDSTAFDNNNNTPADTVLTDSLSIAADTLQTEPPVGDVETTIKYSADDSIFMDFPNQIVKLYGNAKIVYGTIELEAAVIEINYLTHVISAQSEKDTADNVIGKPVFKDGAETYETDDMKYNFQTKKAVIDGVVTQQGEAYMHGSKVYKNQFDELFISRARYTTCNLAEPHFHIESSKLKVIPENKVVSGPFHIRIKDMPTPLGFAFGMFPVPKEKTSGIIFPSYGEERRRGFFLKNGGYYFAINDYIDLQLLGEIYSKGSWGFNIASSYAKRYSYTGRFNFRYNNQKAETEGDSTVINDFWINWSHSPKSKGRSRLSASVSAGSSTYNQNNPTYQDLSRSLNQDFNSSVSYSTSFRGTPLNLSVSSRLQQNISTNIVNLLLPEMALNMNRIYPFKFGNSSAKNPFQKISFSWNMNTTNKVTNAPLRSPGFDVVGFDPNDQDTVKMSFDNIGALWDRALNGARHRIPVTTTMNIFKYIAVNPSFSFEELWYFKELSYEWIDEENAVKIDTLDKFSRAFSYNASVSMNTRLYGIKYFKGEKIQAIRHVMQPTFGMSFRPDFSEDRFGYYQDVQIDSLGNTRRLSKYQGFVYGTPSAGQSASANFGITNNLEMKVKSKNDTVDEPKKVILLDNLSLTSSYNFLADSFNLAPIRISGRTRIFNQKVNINFGATMDPYIYQLDSVYFSGDTRKVAQRRRNIFAWDVGEGIGQISNANLAISMSLNPKARERENELADVQNELSPQEQREMEFIRNNPELYVDFKIPWNLRLNYNLNFTKRGYEEARITQAIQASGNITLTENWKIGFQSGFDIQKQELTMTNFNITRDLHCWQLNFSWTPFGRYESYFLTINAKSSLLQDLKIDKQRSWWDN
jgi:hypothetical protein